MTYPISLIATLIGAHRIGEADTHIDWLLTDSRSLTFPEETLFFAIRTQKNDGHRYLPELYRRGVRAFVVSQAPAQPEPDANYLVVPSPLKALQRLAERHREEFDIPIIGITGSNGKTIVKEWLYQLLAPDFNITRSPRSWASPKALSPTTSNSPRNSRSTAKCSPTRASTSTQPSPTVPT